MAGGTAIFGGEIADGDAAESGCALFGRRWLAKLFWKPGCGESVHIEVENLANAVGLNVFVEDIFDNSAAADASFEPDNFAAAVVGATIGNSNISDAPGGFAAEADEAGGVANVAVANDNVF